MSRVLVFVHINKTAGSTVRNILRASYGPRHCDVEPWHAAWEDPPFSAGDLRRVRAIYPRLASIAGHRITGYVDLGGEELSYFTFLRDPLKTTASRFQYHVDHRKKQGLVFEEWIQRERWRNGQTQRIAGVADVSEAIRIIDDKDIFVALAEQFDESLILLKALRAPDLDIAYRRVNVAKRNTIASDLLSAESTRRLLIDANRRDLELYRYVSEELYPRYRVAYGPGIGDAVETYRRSVDGAFNRSKLVAHRLKHHGIYKPLLTMYRRSTTRSAVERILTRSR